MWDAFIHEATIVTPAADGGVSSFAGSVAVKDGAIAAVLKGSHPREPAKLSLDGRGAALIPGLFNSHLHCDVTLLRGMGDGLTLREQIYGPEVGGRGWFREYLGDEELALSRILAYMEALRGGTTFVCDNAFWSLGPGAARIMKDTGLRGAIVEDIRADFRTPGQLRPLSELRESRDGLLRAGLVPVLGGPAEEDYSVPVLKALKAASDVLEIPVHMHLAETDWRVELCHRTFGARPLRVLEKAGLLRRSLLASHCVWLQPDEVRELAQGGLAAIVSPTSEAKIGDGLAPIAALLEEGATVAIGTDGALWNNSNDMFREMKAFCLSGALRSGPGSVDADDAFRAATIGAAKAFGLEGELGSIEEGKKADLVLVRLEKPHLVPAFPDRIVSLLVFCATGQDVETVLVGGEEVVRSGEVTFPGASILLRSAREAARSLWERLQCGAGTKKAAERERR